VVAVARALLRPPQAAVALAVVCLLSAGQSDVLAQENAPDVTGVWGRLAGGTGRIEWSPIAILHTSKGDTMCHRLASGELWVYRNTAGAAVPPGWHPPMAPPTPTAPVTGTSALPQPAAPGTYILDIDDSHVQRTQLNPKLPEDVRKDLVQRKLWKPQVTITMQPDQTLQVVWSDDEVRYNKESGTVSDIYPHADAAQVYAKRRAAPQQPPGRLPIPGTFPFRYGGPGRWPLAGPMFGDPFAGWQPAGVRVQRGAAFEILQNMLEGKDPFRATKGGVNWSSTEGDPYPGRIEGDPLAIDLPQLIDPSKPRDVQLSSPELDQRYVEAYDQLAMDSLQQYIDAYKAANPNDPDAAGFRLSNSKYDALRRLARSQGEPEMWKQIGEQVRDSNSGIGTVELKDSRFSFRNVPGDGGQFTVAVGRDGQFTLVRNSADITIPGGLSTLRDAIQRQVAQGSLAPEEAVVLDKAASRLLWAGRVRGGFRVLGRAGMAGAALYDGYRFVKSDDKVKTGASSLGGWGGAVLAGEIFAVAWTPADVAGPWAWAAHGVGTLLAGGLGYFGGSSFTGWLVDQVRGNPCDGMI